ncbi:Fatty acid-binding protein [Halotydeus destructor]|nr:Fatty acid-binding protein [Halotydeus destructor]
MLFTGTFNLISFDNFDNFLLELGVNVKTIAEVKKSTTRIKISQDGDTWTIKTTTSFGTRHVTFQLGQEFDERNPGGRGIKSTITQEGNKWIQVQKGEKAMTTVREFTDDGITATSTLNGLTTVQFFKRQ